MGVGSSNDISRNKPYGRRERLHPAPAEWVPLEFERLTAAA